MKVRSKQQLVAAIGGSALLAGLFLAGCNAGDNSPINPPFFVTTSGTTAGAATAGLTTSGLTTSGLTTSGLTTAGATTAGATTAGATTAGATTAGATTAGATTAGATTAGATTAGATTSGVTTSGFTTSGVTTSGATTAGATTAGTTTAGTTGGAFSVSGFSAFSAGGGTSTISQQVLPTNPGPPSGAPTPITVTTQGGTIAVTVIPDPIFHSKPTDILIGTQGQSPVVDVNVANDPGVSSQPGFAGLSVYDLTVTIPAGLTPGSYPLSFVANNPADNNSPSVFLDFTLNVVSAGQRGVSRSRR